MIFSIVFTLSARHSAGFLLSVYGKVRFVVNKEMINTRGWDDLECPPRCSGHIQRKNYFYFAFVALCGALQTHFHGWGRNGKRHLLRETNPLRLTAFASSPKGRALGKKMKFAWTAKGSHFGGAGTAQAVTERVSTPFLRKKSQDLARQAG